METRIQLFDAECVTRGRNVRDTVRFFGVVSLFGGSHFLMQDANVIIVFKPSLGSLINYVVQKWCRGGILSFTVMLVA